MRGTIVCLGVLSLVGCGGGDSVRVRLQPLTSCSEVEQAIRDAALEEMTEALENNQKRLLEGSRYCGYEEDAAYGSAPNAGPRLAGAPAAAQDSSKSSGGASQVSGTNNQVVGVDEADFIKNDNQYIYMVSAGAFRIIEAWPAPNARAVAKLPIEGTPRKLFVLGDRALVYSSLTPAPTSGTGADAALKSGVPSYGSGWKECTYGYSCSFTGDGHPTKISLIDISDRTAPRLIRELKTAASYLNARRIGSAVHTVLVAPGPTFTGLKTMPATGVSCGTAVDEGAVRRAFAALWEENAKIIRETPVSVMLPQLTDTWIDGQTRSTSANLLGSCQGFYKPSRTDGSSFTSIVSLDLSRSTAPVASTIVSRPGAVYASESALYMAVPQQRGSGGDWYPGMEQSSEASTIHRFDLEASPVGSAYAGSGLVKGRVLNQFAMDEWRGDLRIATTTGHAPSPDAHSTMSVLRLRGGSLATIGVLDKLAPSEDIRSVRFDESRAFVVTFKKTDPLFVFDLSNPFGPRSLAELKIPGFSTYMHMMDEGHLLTIGYDASDQGSFAWFTGVRLQIFDVRSPTNPRLVAAEVIGTRGSSSEALTNHLAFTYFAPKNLLALPMTICEGGTGTGMYGTTMTFSGLIVYKAIAETGFSPWGRVSHGTTGASCSNWWTDASSVVKRSIVMDDFVYSVSEKVIKVNNLGSLAVDVKVIPVDN